jgi:hypothetical protein
MTECTKEVPRRATDLQTLTAAFHALGALVACATVVGGPCVPYARMLSFI